MRTRSRHLPRQIKPELEIDERITGAPSARATVDAGGLLTGVDPGTAWIVAHLDGVRDSARVTVELPRPSSRVRAWRRTTSASGQPGGASHASCKVGSSVAGGSAESLSSLR